MSKADQFDMKKRKLPQASLPSSSYKRTNRQITRCHCPWTSLPDEILVTIAELLTAPHGIDFVRFRSVCRAWRSAAASVNFNLVRQMPWIMLQPTFDHSRETKLFNPSENKFYNFPLPEARWTTICAAVKSWVATVGDDGRIHLLDLNPFTRQPRGITLPSLHAAVGSPPAIYGESCFLKKLCLPASPSEDPDGVVVAIYGRQSQLAFARLRTRAWTAISCSTKLAIFRDVTYFKGRFYAVSCTGDVMELDLRRRQAVKIASAPMTRSAATQCLVESDGDLLQVGQCWETELRKVFKLDFQTGQWEAVKSLGDRSLFLGRRNCSMSVHAPHYYGCRSNCIYIITEECNTKDAMVVYSLDEDKEIQTRDMAESVCNEPMSPLWVSPFLWWQKS